MLEVITMSIGKNIRYFRKKAGLTQKQLAEKVGVNEVTIRSYEAGRYEPKTETLYKLVRALDCNIHEILDKPFDLLDDIFISVDNLDKLPQKIEELTGRKLEKDEPPSYFPYSVNNEFTIKVNIDRNSPHNIALKKLDNGKPLTSEESLLIKEYITSDIFRENLPQLPAKFKELLEVLRQNYELLNTEGQEKANEQIDRAAEQIELLTKIPEYQKKNEE